MFEEDDESLTDSYWPSVADLFMTLFIIAIVMLGAVLYIFLPKNNIPALKQVQFAVGQDFNNVIEPLNRLRAEIEMEPVGYKGATQAIKDLTETCDKAILILNELKKSDMASMVEKVAALEAKILELGLINLELKRVIAGQNKQIENGGNLVLAELEQRIKELEKENLELKRDSPSVIIGEQRKDFQFAPGSTLINKDFSYALRFPVLNNQGGFHEPPFRQIASEVINRKTRINTLEIIGHTDGVPLARSGNLDEKLPALLAGRTEDLQSLSAGSNNDLGLLRALSLKREWLNFVETYEPIEDRNILSQLEIRCYSAGQTILPVSTPNPSPAAFRNKNDSARRIEMRLTRIADQNKE
jgi:hypothetical protein